MAEKPKFPYTTFTGLTLAVHEDDGEWYCDITGDITKELARGNFGQVMAVANKTRAHYEERKKAEA